MTRLKQILLAGTILPALTLIPLANVAAQAPDPSERHSQRPEGGPKGEGPRGGGERRQGGPGARDKAQGEGPRNGAGERRQGGPARENAQGEGPRDGERRPGGLGARDNAQGEGPRGGERRPGGLGARDNAQGEGPRGGGGERRQGGPGARDNAQGEGPRGGAAERRQGGPGARDNAQGEGLRNGAGERRQGDRRDEPRVGDRNDRRPGPGGAPGLAVVVSPGFAGGFLPPTRARRLDDLRRDRREVREGDSVFIREPGRTIVQQSGRSFIVHDETDRFRALGLNVRRERRGADFVDITTRPGGDEILTFTDGSGRMLRRVRRTRDGREVVLIDNSVGGRVGVYADDVVVLPPPPMRIPRERYVVDYRDANPNVIYDALIAPPLAAPPRRYTLDQIRYSPDVRNYVRSVDINTINFDSGSWDVPAAATGKLEGLATAINRAVDRNPNAVFLIEGYTDATGNPDDNLSLSDRRAQSVAEILTKDFKVPPENLTTQGYGQQNLKENTAGPSAVNRRVVVRNITQLLAAGDEPTSGH